MYQWVNLRRGGELVKMSTRKASFVTVDEVLGKVGCDVFRYFMVERRADTHLDFDLDLAEERSERNPVYKIQYAHARLCSIARKAADDGLALPDRSGRAAAPPPGVCPRRSSWPSSSAAGPTPSCTPRTRASRRRSRASCSSSRTPSTPTSRTGSVTVWCRTIASSRARGSALVSAVRIALAERTRAARHRRAGKDVAMAKPAERTPRSRARRAAPRCCA